MDYRTIVSISMPASWKEKLANIAQERTILAQRQISLTEVVRDALNEVYDLDSNPPRREDR